MARKTSSMAIEQTHDVLISDLGTVSKVAVTNRKQGRKEAIGAGRRRDTFRDEQ